MRTFIQALAFIFTCSAVSAMAAENPQHERMRNCNKTAKTKALKGDARKAFMKTCLSGEHRADKAAVKTPPVPKKPS